MTERPPGPCLPAPWPPPTLGGMATRLHRFVCGDHGIELVGPADPMSLLDSPATAARYAADNALPYWAELWDAAHMLAGYLLRTWPPAQPGLTGPETILELGCGLGLGGIAVGRLGYPVVLSDYDPQAREFAAINARHNGLTDYRVEALDFRQPPPGAYRHIIAADILYEERLRPVVLDFVRAALRPGGQALIADPDRSAVLSWFAEFVGAPPMGLSISAIPLTANIEGRHQTGTLWRLVRHDRVYFGQ